MLLLFLITCHFNTNVCFIQYPFIIIRIDASTQNLQYKITTYSSVIFIFFIIIAKKLTTAILMCIELIPVNPQDTTNDQIRYLPSQMISLMRQLRSLHWPTCTWFHEFPVRFISKFILIKDHTDQKQVDLASGVSTLHFYK